MSPVNPDIGRDLLKNRMRCGECFWEGDRKDVVYDEEKYGLAARAVPLCPECGEQVHHAYPGVVY